MPVSEDSEMIGEEVTNQLVNLANRMGSHLSADTLCNTAWILRYIKGSMPRYKKRVSRLTKRNQLLEQRLMELEDTAKVQLPVSETLPLQNSRKRNEHKVKEEWRDELLDELVVAIEEYIVRECHPPEGSAATKYWYIMSQHEGPKEEEVAARQTVNFITAAAVALVAAAEMEIHARRVAIEVNKVTLVTAPVACVAVIARSCKLFKPRNVLDLDDEFDAWLPLTAVEEIRFTDAENSQRISVMAAVGKPALQCVTDTWTLLPPAPSLALDLASLTLTFTGPTPLKVSLPWVNLRFLVRAIRTLADKHKVATNFAEQIPTESEDGPAPGLGIFYMPGDPLGSIIKHETEYFEFRRKGKWTDSERRSSRKSVSLREEPEGVSPPVLPPADEVDDVDGTSFQVTPARSRRSLTSMPATSPPVGVAAASLTPAKGRKTRSIFEPFTVAGLTRESMLLKDLWQALSEGIREMCGAVRRATNTNTTLPLLGPFFTAVQALGTRMGSSYSEVDSVRRLTCDLNDLFTSLAGRVEYSAARQLGSVPEAGASQKVARKPDRIIPALPEKEREKERDKDRYILDLKESFELSENTIIEQGSAITSLQKENEKLLRQMRGAAQLLKADKKALLEREQLKEAIKEVEDMAAAVATMKLEVVQYLSNIENPTPIQRSLGTIAWMLQEYRRFLPTAILEQDRPGDDGEDDEQREATRAPPEGNIAMVFTDIQSSTALWEAATEGMTVGLQVHNKIMRTAIKKYDGYEVKTIGDSFMVAFDSAYAACSFALEVQIELTKHEWEADLLQCPDCATYEYEGNVVWHGLRVRIGIHYGHAEMQKNPITGRADYFGPTVNKAARVEAAATGGLIAVTDKVLLELDSMQFETLGDPVVIPYGGVMLKGVTGATDISGLLPRMLGARRSEVGPQEQRGTAPEGSVAILVCDVQNAEQLWKADPESMEVATKMLHEVFSVQMADNNGYEVQRVAEAYTVVFHNAYDACRFAVTTQTLLMELSWPQDLLSHVDACEKQRDNLIIWRGLRLRVGVHYGSVEKEMNPLTKKIEYFGPAMKLAPRVCVESCGGLVLVSQEVLDDLGEQKLGLLGDPVIVKHGARDLPPATEPVFLSSIYAKGLAGREEDCNPPCIIEPKETIGKKPSTFGPIKNFKVGLKLVKATVAYVVLNLTIADARETFTALSSVVSAVEFAAERTEGLVASVYGKTLIVSWNAGRKCKSHETQAVRFANLLHHRLRGGSVRVNVGVASGDVLYGVVAGERRRFTTAIGGCVDAAKALCDSCRDNGNFCLISDHAVELSVVPALPEVALEVAYKQGDAVFVRDSEAEEWKRGVVMEVTPSGVSVKPSGYNQGSVWMHIKPCEQTPLSPPIPKGGKRRMASVISFRRDRLVDVAASPPAGPNVTSPIQAVPMPIVDDGMRRMSEGFGSPANSCYSSPTHSPVLRANSLSFKKGQTQFDPLALGEAIFKRDPVRSSLTSLKAADSSFSSRLSSVTEEGERFKAMEQQLGSFEGEGEYAVTRVESGEMSPMGTPVEAALSPCIGQQAAEVPQIVTPEVRSSLDLRSPADYLFPAPGNDRTRRASSPAVVNQTATRTLSPLSQGSGSLNIPCSPSLTASPLTIGVSSPTSDKPPLRPLSSARPTALDAADLTELLPVRKMRSDIAHTVTFVSPSNRPLEARKWLATSPRPDVLTTPSSESASSVRTEGFDASPRRVPAPTRLDTVREITSPGKPEASQQPRQEKLWSRNLVSEKILTSPTKLSPVKEAKRSPPKAEGQAGDATSAPSTQARLKVHEMVVDVAFAASPKAAPPSIRRQESGVRLGVDHTRMAPSAGQSKAPDVPKLLATEQIMVSPVSPAHQFPSVGSPLSIGKISNLSPKRVAVSVEADYHAVAPDARDWVDWSTRSTAAHKAQSPQVRLARERDDRMRRSSLQPPVLADQNKGLVHIEKTDSRSVKYAVSRVAEAKASTTTSAKKPRDTHKIRELRPVSAPLLGIFKKG